jgi:hypothetical protein
MRNKVWKELSQIVQAPEYVEMHNPNIYHDLMTGMMEPPPQYGYPTLKPQFMTEHLDRVIHEKDELKENLLGTKDNNKKIGGEWKN